MKKTKNLRIIILSAILFIVALTGIIGWAIWDSNSDTSKISDSTFKISYDPLVGGGAMGAVNSYSINSAGQINQSNSKDYRAPITETRVKSISAQELQELRNFIIDSGVMENDAGHGPSYGGEMWTVTVNGKTKQFYEKSSNKFDKAKSKINSVLGVSL